MKIWKAIIFDQILKIIIFAKKLKKSSTLAQTWKIFTFAITWKIINFGQILKNHYEKITTDLLPPILKSLPPTILGAPSSYRTPDIWAQILCYKNQGIHSTLVQRLISALIWDISGLWNRSDSRDYREKRIAISRFLTPYLRVIPNENSLCQIMFW